MYICVCVYISWTETGQIITCSLMERVQCNPSSTQWLPHPSREGGLPLGKSWGLRIGFFYWQVRYSLLAGARLAFVRSPCVESVRSLCYGHHGHF